VPTGLFSEELNMIEAAAEGITKNANPAIPTTADSATSKGFNCVTLNFPGQTSYPLCARLT